MCLNPNNFGINAFSGKQHNFSTKQSDMCFILINTVTQILEVCDESQCLHFVYFLPNQNQVLRPVV